MNRFASSFLLSLAFSALATAPACGNAADPDAPVTEAPSIASVAQADTANPDLLTNRYDNGRTSHLVVPGMNGPAVAAGHWDKRGLLPVDGAIYAQPLFTQQLKMADGALHDVVYVATARNKVYAYDANSLALLWHDDGAAGSAATLPGPDRVDETIKAPWNNAQISPCATMAPTWVDGAPTGKRELGGGIQSTPVIDRNAGLMYVTYRTRPGSSPANWAAGHAEEHVAAIRLTDGVVVRDVAIPASAFAPFTLEGTRQRPSLLLVNGVIYLGFASHCEEYDDPYKYVGRVLAVDAATLALVGAFAVVDPSMGIVGGGIWQASTGLAADANGDVYFATGNRQHGTAFTSSAQDVVNSIVRLRPALTKGVNGGVAAVTFPSKSGATGAWDWFTPYRAYWHNKIDLDLGSAGLLLPPGTNSLVGGGKEGVVYVLDRDHLGGVDANAWTDTQINALDANGCFSLQEGGAWCNTGNAGAACVMSPDLATQDARPGSQKLAVGSNFECRVLGTPVRAGNWGQYPHIHNTPAYAHLLDGRELMYLWPEKDHLKAFQRDTSSATLKFLPTSIDAPALAPARGMPGGFITVATDSQTTGGVVFAAVPQTADQDAYGALVAYDAVPAADGTLHQVWSAYNKDEFRFAKFVPPTIAVGKVFLATFSNAVEVYGPTAGPDLQMAQATVGAVLQDPNAHEVTAAVVEPSGQIAIFGEKNDTAWARLASIGSPGQYPVGGAVTFDVQNGSQLDVLAVGNDGALHVSWLALSSDPRGAWLTAAVTGGALYPPGAKIATAHQTDQQLDAFLVGNDGRLHEVAVTQWGAWQDRLVTAPGTEPVFAHGNCVLGGCVKPAVGVQGAQGQQLDVAAVDVSGVLWVYATSASAGHAAWGRFDVLGGQHLFPATADLVAARQRSATVDNQLDLFAVDNSGVLEVMWVADFGNWLRYAMTGAPFIVGGAVPGSHVSVGNQGAYQLDVALAGKDGTVQIYYAVGLGAWSGSETGTIGIASPGAPITMVPQSPGGNQLDVLVPRANGIFGVFTAGAAWQGPFRAL